MTSTNGFQLLPIQGQSSCPLVCPHPSPACEIDEELHYVVGPTVTILTPATRYAGESLTITESTRLTASYFPQYPIRDGHYLPGENQSELWRQRGTALGFDMQREGHSQQNDPPPPHRDSLLTSPGPSTHRFQLGFPRSFKEKYSIHIQCSTPGYFKVYTWYSARNDDREPIWPHFYVTKYFGKEKKHGPDKGKTLPK